jgi:hypothetical protein
MPCKKAEQQAHWDVHSTNTSQQAGAWATINANEYDSYNTYGVLWTPQTLTFYYNGLEVAQTPTPSDFTQQMYLIADLAIVGTWPRGCHRRGRNDEHRLHSCVLERLQHTRRRPPDDLLAGRRRIFALWRNLRFLSEL